MKKLTTRISILLSILLVASPLAGCRQTTPSSEASASAASSTASPLVPVSGTSANQPVRAAAGMVASTDVIASRVGVEIMKRGGNAIDAAVAVGLALAVSWPSAGNIGGGGFMMIRRADGSAEIIDYRERAPLAASRNMYLDEQGNVVEKASTVGYKAVGVPGTVAGFAKALERHGKLKWADVVEPARKLAAEGVPVSYHLARSLRGSRGLLKKFPDSKRIFLRDRRFYKEGERFVQPELAATLSRIKANGPREFYEGKTAQLIADDMKAGRGLITVQDLREYEPTIRQPLKGTYRGYELLTMPPPSSGGTALLEMLNVLSHYKLSELGHNSSEHIHLLVEVMRRAFADRAAFLGDADFVKVPIGGLT
ncbi:MAG TPA: gamma-glutamyltransferase, partial [Blastocatellia bacterium]|nr:gamma-glutamyltransferase [Blastocatellia bacterium]